MNITLCCNLMACFVRIFYHSCYVLYSFKCIVLLYLCKFSLFLQCHFINGPQFPFVLLFSVAYISYCATEFNDPYHTSLMLLTQIHFCIFFVGSFCHNRVLGMCVCVCRCVQQQWVGMTGLWFCHWKCAIGLTFTYGQISPYNGL